MQKGSSAGDLCKVIIYVSVPVQLLEHVTSATKGSEVSLAAVRAV